MNRWPAGGMYAEKSNPSDIIILNSERPFLHGQREISHVSGIELPVNYANLSALSEKGKTLAPKKMYAYVGKMFPGESIPFEPTSEPFSQYTLADGTTVKVKMVMLDAARLDTFNDQGEPVYQFQFQQILGVVAPDSLKRKAQ